MEIIVVIGISAVLFFLLLGPLINSFRLTETAQRITAAQDAGRRTLEVLSRELGTAAYVFDNTSHPFAQLATVDSQYTQDKFSNFLDLDIPVDPATSPAQPTVPAHAYNAKLDFVLPRHNSSGDLVDPTTGEPITITGGSAASTGLTFPLAPSTSMVRYWVGRRDPTRLYATHGEGSLLAKNGNNTYILYRAQFSPYNAIDTATQKPKVNGDTTTIDEDLFTPKLDSTGNPVNLPEFDDPDFFRTVTDADINWLDAQHRTYGATGQTVAHNARVQRWMQIAKPIISSPNTDLILMPHRSDNSLNYTPYSALGGESVAASGVVQDPTSGGYFPVVNSSVTFRFGSVSADAHRRLHGGLRGRGIRLRGRRQRRPALRPLRVLRHGPVLGLPVPHQPVPVQQHHRADLRHHDRHRVRRQRHVRRRRPDGDVQQRARL